MEACTAVYPDRGAYALGLLCADFDIPLEHHNALSDAEGCGKLLLQCLRDGLDPAPFVKSFDLLRTPDEKRRQKRPPRKRGAALQAQATVRDWLEPLCSETVRNETAERAGAIMRAHFDRLGISYEAFVVKVSNKGAKLLAR